MTHEVSYGDGETHRSVLESAGLHFFLSGPKGSTVVHGLTQLELEGKSKTICLFFSANWCRPCRTFTPQLLHLYNSLNRDKFEILFVSFDRDEISFSEHVDAIPWLAAPFDAEVRTRLCHRYHIQRIPSLIPLACDVDGRSRVGEDAIRLVEDYGVEAFPFSAKRREELEAMDEAKRHGHCKLQELLGSSTRDYVISADGTQIPIADLVGQTVGLYFGAHWCPPCRSFTTILTEAYHELRSSANFHIIFISTDRDGEEFASSMEEMPWLSIPYSDRISRHELSRIFKVKGIPALVLLGPDGKVVSTDGRAIISNYGAGAFPFTESRIAEMEMGLRKQGEGLACQLTDFKLHDHTLTLDTAGAYVCDACGHQGKYWVYSCHLCNFDIHPTCVEAMN